MAQAVAMTIVIAAAMLVMGSCDRKPVMAHSAFTHLPNGGWQRTMPLSFRPEYDDSAARYDVTLAVRHDNSYRTAICRWWWMLSLPTLPLAARG